MRIPIRTSRLAIWSRRLSSFALPLVLIPIVLHRARNIDSETFFLIETIGMGFAALGVVVGAAALVRLWFSGDRGWGRAVAGFFLGLLCLSPLSYAGMLYARYPMVHDVATTNQEIALERADGEPVTLESDQDADLSVFPNLIARQYLLPANQTYRMVDELIAKRGWTVLRSSPPQLERAVGQINATDRTFLGWTDEIAVKVTGLEDGAQVDVRSASLAKGARHDLGRNGSRIEAFLQDLDDRVTEELRRGAALDAPPIPVAPRGEGE